MCSPAQGICSLRGTFQRLGPHRTAQLHIVRASPSPGHSNRPARVERHTPCRCNCSPRPNTTEPNIIAAQPRGKLVLVGVLVVDSSDKLERSCRIGVDIRAPGKICVLGGRSMRFVCSQYLRDKHQRFFVKTSFGGNIAGRG